VASWSGIDHYRRWKAMHYFMKKAFQSETVIFIDHKAHLDLFTLSGSPMPDTGRLTVELLDFEGNMRWFHAQDARLSPDSALQLVRFPLSQFRAYDDPHRSLLRARLYKDDELLHENLYYFTEPKHLKLPLRPDIRASVEAQEDGSYLVILTTDALAKNVFLAFEDTEGFFADNYFDLLPGTEAQVRFTPKGSLEEPLATEKLVILHLAMTH
jgi:beta-mannosidase